MESQSALVKPPSCPVVITDQTRQAVECILKSRRLHKGELLFSDRVNRQRPLAPHLGLIDGLRYPFPTTYHIRSHPRPRSL